MKRSAIRARLRGSSLRAIEKRLGIPKSTLHHWFRGLVLAPRVRANLEKKNKEGLHKARLAAARSHNEAKLRRLASTRHSADMTLTTIGPASLPLIELSLAMLYLGEGMKRSEMTALASSDARILRFFVSALSTLYLIPLSDMRCELHLRYDQDDNAMKQYWSRLLGIPKDNFSKSSFDRRSAGKQTYSHYMGVCVVRCGRVEIMRKLMYIAETFCETIAGRMRG